MKDFESDWFTAEAGENDDKKVTGYDSDLGVVGIQRNLLSLSISLRLFRSCTLVSPSQITLLRLMMRLTYSD